MYDLDAIKSEIYIMDLIDNVQSLKRIASTDGGEFAGPCPFCGGKDRFHVQPQKNRWFCRQCSEGWGDVISYAKKMWPHLTFPEICEKLGGSKKTTPYIKHQKTSIPASSPPATWQSTMAKAISEFENDLWKNSGSEALDYLHSRGLKDQTIQQFRLGYSCGKKYDDLWIQRGITIPCIANEECWYLKISLLPGQFIRCKCQDQVKARERCPKCGTVNKYRGVNGNRTNAIFNADKIIGEKNVIFCEGEFDCMIATQELANTIPAATFGSTTNIPDLGPWGPYLLCLQNGLIIYDNDKNNAGQKGAKAIRGFIKSAVICKLPEGNKDINEFFLNGGNLNKLVMENFPDTELKVSTLQAPQLKLEKNSKTIVEGTTISPLKTNAKVVKHCYACGGTDYWQHGNGELVCSRCHPKPSGV